MSTGDGGDGRVTSNRARGLNADGNRAAFVMRSTWQVPVGKPRLLQQNENGRRASGRGALQVRPLVATLAGRLAPTPRRESAHHSRPRVRESCVSYQNVPDEGSAGVGRRQTGKPLGKRAHQANSCDGCRSTPLAGDFQGFERIPIRSQGTQSSSYTRSRLVEDGARPFRPVHIAPRGWNAVRYITVTQTRGPPRRSQVVQEVTNANLPRFQSVCQTKSE